MGANSARSRGRRIEGRWHGGAGLGGDSVGHDAGCLRQPENPVMVVSSPYQSGQRHTEPVFYNGKH